MKTPALHAAAEFFKLPVSDLLTDGPGITPLETRDQPVGFVDKEGSSWHAVATEDGLKRQRF